MAVDHCGDLPDKTISVKSHVVSHSSPVILRWGLCETTATHQSLVLANTLEKPLSHIMWPRFSRLRLRVTETRVKRPYYIARKYLDSNEDCEREINELI